MSIIRLVGLGAAAVKNIGLTQQLASRAKLFRSVAVGALAVLAFGSEAAVTQFVAGMTASGSAPFDANDNPGNDSSISNTVIRTNDFATYRVGYSITPSDTNARLVLAVGATTLPGAYVGPASPRIAFFSVADLPTGANGCQNISATAVADPPATGISGVTANGQKLYCAQPSPTSGNNLDFRMRIAGTAPNGATVSAPTVTFSSTSNSASSTPTVLSGTVGAESFYGMPTLTISATPRWNLLKSNVIRGALFVPGSGPAGEDGFIFSWNLGIFGKGSRKGLEAINGAYTIAENFNDPDFPNARFVDWNINSPGYMVANLSSTGLNGCGDWHDQIPILGNSVDNSFYYPNDYGNTNNSTAVYQVARGGTCDVTAVNNAAKTATLTLNNTDFSLAFYPTKRGQNPAAATLVNPSNLDDANNEWWVASKSVLVWAPVTDVPTPPNPNTLQLTNTATLNATSVTGQSNVEPITTDNAHTEGATRSTAGTLGKYHSTVRYTNPFGLDYAACDPNVTGACHVNQVAPNQVLSARISAVNLGTSSYPAGVLCDKIDNARFTFFDATNASYVQYSGYVKDALTGITVLHLSGPQFPITWELGVGGTGTTGGTWNTMNTVTSEYTAPSTSGSTQSDTACGDTDATWYPSVSALLSAEGAAGLKKVTRIRAKYASFPPASRILVYPPQQANANYAYSGTDNSPGSAFVAGASTTGAMAINQLLWETNVPGVITATGVGKAADAVKIFQNEYVRVTKTSPSNPIADSLVPVGSNVTYNLTVNLTTSGSAHTTDVTVWDVLPQYMGYVPGSSTLGGAAIADPVCATSGLPAALFPTQPLTGGVTACKWVLTAQTAAKASEGAAAGNLPTLAFKAVVDVLAPNSAQLLNTSFADSTDNGKPDAIYQGAASGFACGSGQNCSFSNWNLTVSSTPGILLSKQVSIDVVPVNTGFTYTLNYAAVGNSLNGVRLLDVLPYAGDGRSPTTAYAGTIKLTAPIATPVAAAGPPAVVADPNAVILYTSNAFASISRDPYDVGHNLSGLGTNTATTTNWCTVAQFGSAACPANIGAVTAFLVQPRLTAGTNPNQLQPGNSYALTVPVVPASNVVGNIYSNDFVGDSTSLTARRPGSNTVSTTVVAPDLIISKTASPTTVIAGQATTFTLVVKNNTGTNVGPIENVSGTVIRVVDPMPTGLTVSLPLGGTNWDCSASTATQVDCTYTGTLPLGTGATIGGPITVTALSAAGTANNTTVQNTATVSMTGQSEQPTTNNSSTASVTILRNPDATIVKTVSPSTVQSGGTVTYTLRASLVASEGNLAGGPATVTDTLPADITIASAAAVSGTNWNCTASTAPSTVSCTYSGAFPISAGSQIGGDITVTTTAGVVSGTVVRNNSASVSVPGDSNPNNNTSTVPVTIQGSTAVSGRVYRETGANTVDNGNATDPGLPSNVSISCTGPGAAPAFNAGPTATAADGTYSFAGVPIGATCAITQTQPVGHIDAYTTAGTSNGGSPATTGTTITGIVVPAAGSTGNNFAEIQTTDTTSSIACVPNPANPTQSVTCTLTCTNNGPAPALGASCQFTGSLPAGVTANSCSAPATSASLAVSGTLSCAVTFPAPLSGSVTVSGGSAATNDSNGGNVATAGNNPSSTSLTVNGVPVSGRVYLEKSTPANTSDNGNAVDPGLVTQVSISCTAPSFAAGPISTAADGTYSFSGVPAGASCTITEVQPAGYTNAYTQTGTTGNPSALGAVSTTGSGTASNSTITITVPSTGSTQNNFAEQAADTTSSVVCVPNPANPTQSVTCTLTCTNNGPGAAVGASCQFTGSLPAGVTSNTCSAPATSASLALNATLTCAIAFPAPLNGSVTVTGGSAATNDTNGGNVATAGNNPSSTTLGVNGVSVAGRVYVEKSVPANTVDNSAATDTGLVTQVSISCTTPSFAAGPISTAADGTYSFSGVPAGASCTITEVQPTGYTNAYVQTGTTGNPGALGAVSAAGAGSTANSTIAITVPPTGSTQNNFAEQAADTTSSVACVPNPANPTQSVTCTLTCTNNGPGAAVGATCQFTGTLPTGITANSCSAPATSPSLAVNASLSCAITFPAPLNGTVTVTGGSAAVNDVNGGNVPTAGNNPSTTTLGVNGVTVAGRVYVEMSTPANTSDNGNAVDPGLVTQVSISCTAPTFAAGPISTAADGTYSFSGVPAGASCTITEVQPAGYTNAYTQTGTTGNPSALGAVSTTGSGTASNSTITITVPSTGSTQNNFAEQAADMVSKVVCTPLSGTPGTTVSCTVTCTNNGPGAAINGFCAVTNAATLPGNPTPTCSPSSNVPVNGTLTCTVSFVMPSTSSPIYVKAGTGADNDTNGGSVGTAGNNPSEAFTTTEMPVPVLNGVGLLTLMLILSLIGLVVVRRQRMRS